MEFAWWGAYPRSQTRTKRDFINQNQVMFYLLDFMQIVLQIADSFLVELD